MRHQRKKIEQRRGGPHRYCAQPFEFTEQRSSIMASFNVLENRVFVNVSGAEGTLARTIAADLKKGDNTIALKDIGSDAGLVSLTKPAGAFADLDLVSARVDTRTGKGVKRTGATLSVHAEEAGTQTFTVNVGLAVGVRIAHSLTVTPEGIGELSSQAQITNGSQTAIKAAKLTVAVGDNQNGRRGAYSAALESRSSFGGTAVDAANASVYLFELSTAISAKPGESPQVNLYGQDFRVGTVARELTFQGYGANTYAPNEGSSDAGTTTTTYSFENTAENGLGLVLAAGSVAIRQPSGALLSATSIGNTSVGDKVKLDGGQAFDIESTRSQTSFDKVGRPTGDRDSGIFQSVRVGQEIKFKNCGTTDQTINVADAIAASADPDKPTKVTNVTRDGVALQGSEWSYDADALRTTIVVKAGQEVAFGYTVETVNQTY
jgi:hypothetical protein